MANKDAETVTITMSRRQAEIIAAATEEYLRLRLGQFRDLADDLAYHLIPDNLYEQLKWVDQLVDFCNYMYNKEWHARPIPDNALVAETVWLAIRSKLAWHDNPNGNMMDVRFDPVYSRCNEQIPEVVIND